MAKGSGFHLRPQDILILLKLVAWSGQQWRQLDLGQELNLSQAEIANALGRLQTAGLVDESRRKVMRLAASEFLIHAVKYLSPPEIGARTRGVSTARSQGKLKSKLMSDAAEQLVWPDAAGNAQGMALKPIHPSVPIAARKDPELHDLLSLVDAIRVGRARERKLAESELTKRLTGANAP